MTNEATEVQTTETTMIKEAEGGHEMSTGQEAEDIDLDREHTDMETTSQQLKPLRVLKKPVPRKKTKACKASIDPITLTEGDMFDISEMIRSVTKDAL